MTKINLNLNKLKKKYKIKKNIKILYLSPINNPKNNSLIFCVDLEDKNLKKLKKIKDSFIILDINAKFSKSFEKKNFVIKVKNPRYEYINILDKFETKKNLNKIYKPINSVVPKSTTIEPFVFIDENVKIGNNCIIKSGAKIFSNVIIGDNSIIGPNSVIGYEGFGIDRDGENSFKDIPIKGKGKKMKHYGQVVIGSDSDIGALNTIAKGVIGPTVLGKNILTSDNVHISHNCVIDENVAIAGSVLVSGSAKIGKNSWIGPNSTILQKVRVGKKNIIGISTTIFVDTPDNTKWLGNPAKRIPF